MLMIKFCLYLPEGGAGIIGRGFWTTGGEGDDGRGLLAGGAGGGLG